MDCMCSNSAHVVLVDVATGAILRTIKAPSGGNQYQSRFHLIANTLQ